MTTAEAKVLDTQINMKTLDCVFYFEKYNTGLRDQINRNGSVLIGPRRIKSIQEGEKKMW